MTQRRQQLRRQIRQQRQALSHRQRLAAGRALRKALAQALSLQPASHIAVYLPNDGELPLHYALQHPRLRHSAQYLPRLNRCAPRLMEFRLYKSGARLARNHFGIPEPATPVRARAAWAVDIMLVPAVAFDSEGYRLGMGGGFYDRTLADLQRRPRRPRLITAGYAFQQCAKGEIPLAPWDQPVDQIITVPSGSW